MDFYFNNNSTYVTHNLNNITANWHLINTLFLIFFKSQYLHKIYFCIFSNNLEYIGTYVLNV